VVYTRQARDRLLDIPRASLAGMRSASEPYALLLARTSQTRFAASWGLAETGATGPTGNRYGDPAGHSCLAIAGIAEQAITLETGSADRLANMHAFAAAALNLLLQQLSR
jgi:nicotinamide-nucleotide amidase